MGWSLNGILGAAIGSLGASAENWASRGIIKDEELAKEQRRDAQTAAGEIRRNAMELERAKAVADYGRIAKEKDEMAKKDSVATAIESLDWSATKDKDGPNLKKGTPEYYRFMGDGLAASGVEDVAKQMYSNADKFDDNARADRTSQANLANAAATRYAASAGRESALEVRKAELEFVKDKDYRAALDGLGTYKFKSKSTGDDAYDRGGLAIVKQADTHLKNELKIEDREDRYNALAKIRSMADSWRETHPAASFTKSMQEATDQFIIDFQEKLAKDNADKKKKDAAAALIDGLKNGKK